ncbi:MAG: hypothetical protein IJX75_01990 [Clostridia bacterium]|nr:hypothetical protein [Clostridia bacterium]
MVKVKKSFLAVVMAAFAMLVSWFAVAPQPIEASAATNSKGTATRIITVVTKANWWQLGSESITLTQSKGKVQAWNYLWTGNTNSAYATWKITVRSTDGKHTATEYLTGKTKKIKLKPNKTYKITVEWANYINWDKGFVATPTWRVSATHKVSKYY